MSAPSPLFFTTCVNAQPASVISDGFSDEAAAWLKKHPSVEKCADQMVDNIHKKDKSNVISYAQYGEFIEICGKKSTGPAKVSKKMMGDVVDTNKNASPNNAIEAKNKKSGKEWQDNSGFIHFPDGSVSSRPID